MILSTFKFLNQFAIFIDNLTASSMSSKKRTSLILNDISNRHSAIIRHTIFPVETFFG